MSNYFLNRAYEIYGYIAEKRRHLHKYPELSFQEFNTSKFIQETLSDLEIEYTVMAGTGVVARIGKGKNCVALRADIDALPIIEETGLEFCSTTPGVMHACGHDMHSSMLLGAAKMLKEKELELNGVVKLIFQPGEEKIPGGASILIQEGVLENPKPSAIFGQHVFPDAPMGTILINEGSIMASADELYWTITGKSSHGASPHLGKDPIIAAASLITYLQTAINKFRNPLTPGVLSVTSIHGGSATNIFPDEVRLMGTLRAYDNEWRAGMHELIEKNSMNVCSLYNCDCEVRIEKGYLPVINDKITTAFAKDNAQKLLGKDNIQLFEPAMWAEDFAYYQEKVPGTFWFLGVKPDGTEQMPGLHNSKFNPDERALIVGAALMAHVAFEYLEK
jgi:amidohydrolase